MAEDVDRYLRGESVKAKLPTPVAVAKARKAGGGKKAKGRKAPQRGARDEERASPLVLVGIGVLVLLIVLGIVWIVYMLASGD